MILALFTELLSAGGVQFAGRQTAAVLAELAHERKLPYRFLSLNDPGREYELSFGSMHFRFRGFARGKAQFSRAGIQGAAGRTGFVVAGHPHLAPPAAAVKMISPKRRMLVMAHGIEVWDPMTRIRRAALCKADLLTAPSGDTARKLVEIQQAKQDRVSLLPWSIDPELWALAQSGKPGRPAGLPDGRVVLTVGRWMSSERYKGLDHLIRAVAVIRRDVPDMKLIAIGNGDDLPRLQALAHEAGVTDRVHFLAKVSREELAGYYAHCDLFALPSAGEGFGLVFLEAMAFGKPVIGGAHGGTPDVVEDGSVGYLVRHGDAAQLCDAMKKLLADSTLRGEMGTRGRELVRSRFLLEHFKTRLARCLDTPCEF
jgi:phosphatidyl-myo-inositol dimannoside synthase